jgi:hypothetical protein
VSMWRKTQNKQTKQITFSLILIIDQNLFFFKQVLVLRCDTYIFHKLAGVTTLKVILKRVITVDFDMCNNFHMSTQQILRQLILHMQWLFMWLKDFSVLLLTIIHSIAHKMWLVITYDRYFMKF